MASRSDRYDDMDWSSLVAEAARRGWECVGWGGWTRPVRGGERGDDGGECVRCVAGHTAYRGDGLDPHLHTDSPAEALRVALRWDDEDSGAQTDDRPTATRVDLTPAQMGRLAAASWQPGSMALGEWMVLQAEIADGHGDAEWRARVAEVEVERDRLRRIVAVEQGRLLPDGWERDDDPVPGLHYAVDGRWAAWTTWDDEPGRYRWGVEDLWRARPGPWHWGGVEGSMLEAVEAAEAQMRPADAAEGSDDG